MFLVAVKVFPRMFRKRCDVLAFWVSFVVLLIEKTFCEQADCYPMKSGIKLCFFFDGSRKNLNDSKFFCKDNGGFLLEIYNEEMQNLVEKFRKNKINSIMFWLNLVRTNSDKWVWGGKESQIDLTYSKWEGSNPVSTGYNIAFMNLNYKWMNSYDPSMLSTICIQGNRESYFSNSGSISSSAAIGIGVGVGLGGLVLIIVSSLLVAKFVFHKEIPCSFKSSRGRKSSPRETGSGVTGAEVVYDGYEQIDESKIGVIESLSGPRATYAEVIVVPDPHESQTKNYYNNNSNKKVLEYADLEISNPSNSKQEPERIAAPDGTLYTKTFEKKQTENLTTD